MFWEFAVSQVLDIGSVVIMAGPPESVEANMWLGPFLNVYIRIIWRFPKIRGTFLEVPIIRTIVFWPSNYGAKM